MRDAPVSEVMDAIEERAESTLQVLAVLESAQMMRVTRQAILESLEEERRRERDRFQALRRTGASRRRDEPTTKPGASEQTAGQMPPASESEGTQQA